MSLEDVPMVVLAIVVGVRIATWLRGPTPRPVGKGAPVWDRRAAVDSAALVQIRKRGR